MDRISDQMSSLPMPETCGTCRHWLSPDGKGGVCRRYPPTPFIIGIAPASAIHDPSKPQTGVPITQSFFPQMLAIGSCGEYQPKERPQ